MAHTASAKKRIRQNEKQRVRNKAAKSSLATRRRKFEEKVSENDVAGAADALRTAQKALAQAGAKGVIHKKTASRKISRMAKRLAAAKSGAAKSE